jgi:hypothetical protein
MLLDFGESSVLIIKIILESDISEDELILDKSIFRFFGKRPKMKWAEFLKKYFII